MSDPILSTVAAIGVGIVILVALIALRRFAPWAYAILVAFRLWKLRRKRKKTDSNTPGFLQRLRDRRQQKRERK